MVTNTSEALSGVPLQVNHDRRERMMIGKTTRQLEAASSNAIFIWCNENTLYLTLLARSLGRTDIQVKGPGWLENSRGHNSAEIIVDHSTRLTDRQWNLVQQLQKRHAHNICARIGQDLPNLKTTQG